MTILKIIPERCTVQPYFQTIRIQDVFIIVYKSNPGLIINMGISKKAYELTTKILYMLRLGVH